GRLTIKTIENGQPDDNQEPYREDLSQLKQRALSRARERTKRVCHSIYSESKINAVGHIKNITRVEKVRLLRDGQRIQGFPFGISARPDAQYFHDLIKIDEAFRGYMEVVWRAKD